MKKSNKILLGLATLWPFVYMVIFFVAIGSLFIFMPEQGEVEQGPPGIFLIIFPLHLLTMLWIMGLTIFYIVNVFRNDRVDKDKKVLWAVVIFMGNMIAMPIYWYLYIWREATHLASSPPAALGSADTSSFTNETRASQREPEYVPPGEPPNWR
jgi:hypothetical protein